MRSIQGRIIIIFFSLILLAMQFIGVYLLRSLEAHYLSEEEEKRIREAQLLANYVTDLLLPDGSGELEIYEIETQGDSIQQLLEEFNRGRYYMYVMVIDRDGTVIAATDPALLGQRTLQETAALRALEEAAVRAYQRLDPETGTRHLGAVAPVLGPDGVSLGAALVEGDFSVIEQTLVAIRNILFTSTVVVAAAAVFLAWVMSRTITGPIRAITARAAEMAAGDFEQKIEVRSHDELGQLAAMFNHLAQRLKETLDEISREKSKLETILSHMADGVVAFDDEGNLFMANPAARRMLGIDPNHGDPELLRRAGEQLWNDWGLDQEHEEPLIVERGDRILSVYLAQIPAGGNPGGAGTVCVLHDITEMEQLERLRKEFVANVSHELRTPLTAIKSYSETLLADEQIDGQTRRSFLQVIHDETDRMARLVRDLLDLSQLESHRATWDREYCLLSELAQRVLTKLQPQIAAKNLQVFVKHRGSLPEPLIYADPDRLQQVLLNIVSNAVEFTPDGGTIAITIEPGEQEVLVEVSDTGIGIPAEDLPRLFDRFYRVDKSRTRQMGGTGLGLAIARQIVEGHGGRISVTSTLGQGTTVSFTVPYEQVDLAD